MIVRIFLLALSLLLGSSAFAQSAEKIIDQHIKAVGGKKALKSITSVRIVGEAQPDSAAGGGQGPAFVWQMKAPSFTHLETGDFVEAFNGRSAWREDAAGGLRTLTGREQLRTRAAAFFRNDRFLNYKKDKTRVQLAGRDTVAGRATNAVLLTTRTGLQRKLWFDAQTHLLVQEESEREDGPEQILYSDYRAVGGVQEPHRILYRRAGRTHDIRVRTVTHNAALDSALFDFPRRDAAPLPDVGELLIEVQKNQKLVDDLQDKYTYNVTETNIAVDGKGNVRQKSERNYEVFYVDGNSYWKLAGKDGKPLSESDARKEQEKVEKYLRDHEEQKKKDAKEKAKDKARKKSEDDDDVNIAAFLRISQLVNPRRERFRGQQVIVFDFEPRPGYKPRGRSESLVHKLAGTIWIDEGARQVARLEARMMDSFRVGGGLLASVGRGSAIVLEQELLHNEVWLPSYAEMNLSARVLLVAGVKVNRLLRFSNYQRFHVESTSEIKPPAQPPD